MTAARLRFSQEFKDALCQEVIATSKPIREVDEAYGVGTQMPDPRVRETLAQHRQTPDAPIALAMLSLDGHKPILPGRK